LVARGSAWRLLTWFQLWEAGTGAINRFCVFIKMAELLGGSWADISAWILALYWEI